MNLKLKCHDANHICDKNQYREASLWEKVKLTLHLIYCRACRKYSSRNSELTKIVNSESVQTIGTQEKELMKQRLQEQISGSN